MTVPLLDGRIGLDDEHELAVLAGLHRLRRDDGRVWQRREPQLTRANWPGHSRRSVLSNVAFSLIVSVDASTALSTKASARSPAAPSSSCGVAVDRQLAAAMCCLIVGEVQAGTEKVT